MNRMLAALAFAAVAVCPVVAQTSNIGCDGAVTAKAGRGGPCSELAKQIAEVLAPPSVSRAHWGIAVTAMDGTPIYSLNDGQFFQPASNTKMFTTATAMALMGPNATFETKVVARGRLNTAANLTGDVVIVGGGDPNLSGRAIPYVRPADRPKPAPGAPPMPEPDGLRYLKQMADDVAKSGLKVVNGDVVGDDTLFPWEPYPEDWSIDDALWYYGAPASALTIADSQLSLKIVPGSASGQPAVISLDPIVPYYSLDTTNLTTGPAKSGSHVQIDRAPGSKVLRLWGSIAVDSQPDDEEIAIIDPAEYAAIAFKAMLEQRGILVTGVAKAKHRLPTDSRGYFAASHEPLTLEPRMYTAAKPSAGAEPETILSTHTSAALIEDLVWTNKISQNLHAELALHNVGAAVVNDGSIAGGARVIRSFLTTQAGIDPDDFIFFDGSGLSGHGLLTPRATIRLLQYVATQPWFADWKRTLPVAGEDGSLRGRFPKEPLKDHVYAKTGTLGETRALGGYIECASGRTVIFSIMDSTHMPHSSEDMKAMDKIVGLIAAAN
jgi:D-alanyl-D-alanine carboxypeptidase/D-alanyl-D-alanine-endopeptidase (penicillin-binding protein 4)